MVGYYIRSEPDQIPIRSEDVVRFAYKNIELKYDDDHTTDMDVATGM